MTRPIRLQHALLPLLARPNDAAFGCAFSCNEEYDPGTVDNWVVEVLPRYGTTRTAFVSGTAVTVADQVITVSVALDAVSDDDEDVTLEDIVAETACTWSMTAQDADDALLWRVQGEIDFVDKSALPIDGKANIGSPISLDLGEGTTVALTILGNTAASSVDGATIAAVIHAGTEKVSVAANDEFGIADSAATYGWKRLKWSTITSAVSSLITSAISGLMVKSANLSDLTSASTARTNLGLGSLATQSGTFSGTSSGTNTGDQDLSGLMVKSANLSDLANAVTARTNLGLAQVAATGAYADLSGIPAAFDPASPGAIGGATPAAGAFTTLAASSSLTLGVSGTLIGGTNLIEQRNGANAQTLNLYNTYTDATTYERGFFKFASNTLRIGTEKGSIGGAARALELQTDGITRLTISTSGSITTAGPLTIGNGNDIVLSSNAQLNWGSGFGRVQYFSGFMYLAADSGHGVIFRSNGANDRLTITSAGAFQFWDGANFQVGTTTGTKIGTATSEKLGFWNATPVVQQVLATGAGATADDIITMLQTLGLCKQS